MRGVLGTGLDGDAEELMVPGPWGPLGRVRLAALAFSDLETHCLVIGGTGTGKTVTQLRLVAGQMATQRANLGEPPLRVIFIDAKGLGGEDRDRFLALARRYDYRRVVTWPEQPLAGLEGSKERVRERLSGLFDASESAFHHAEAVAMLDLALGAGEVPRTLAEIVERVRPGVTRSLYSRLAISDANQREAEAASFTNQQWTSLYLRLRALSATIGDRLDATSDSWRLREVDAAWLRLPGTSAPQTAGDVAAWILALVGELAESNDGRPTLIVLDEFSAVAQDARASARAAGLVERTRSAKVAIVIGAQTVSSLGEHAERLLHTCGLVIAHRNPAPEALISLVGTVPVWEDTHEVDHLGIRTSTSGRRQHQFRVDPNLIRQLSRGESLILCRGRFLHCAVADAIG